ncbi:hypothetical protein IKE71_00195, partial [Candidatus Saccharibacteria bacterium]|nr:hypothetical protein [Candidatus Saccharibacteria bacterium]
MSKQIICPHDETYVHKFKTHRRCLYGSVLSLFLFISAFVIVPALISEVSATDATTDVTWKSLSLTLDPDYGNGSTSDLGHGDVDFGEIVPTGANDAGNVGTMKVAKKTIGVFSAGNYYSVFLSMAGTSNSLTKTGDTTQNISAVSGTWSS